MRLEGQGIPFVFLHDMQHSIGHIRNMTCCVFPYRVETVLLVRVRADFKAFGIEIIVVKRIGAVEKIASIIVNFR